MRTLGKYILHYKFLLISLFGLIFIQSLSQLYLPTLMGNIVDKGVVNGDIPYIWKIGLIMLFVAAIGVVMSIFISHYAAKIAMGVGQTIRKDVFTHASRFSLAEFSTFGTSSLITRTINDVTQIQQALIMFLRMILMAPFMLIGGLIMALSKDAKLSLIILAAIPFIFILIYFIMKKAYPLFTSVQARLDELNLILREYLTGIRIIRAFVKDDNEAVRLTKANFDLMTVSIKVNRLMAVTMPFMMLLMNMTVVLIIWFGAQRIDFGAMQIGDLMAYIQYVMLIMFALMMASMLFFILPRATVSAFRIEEVLQLEHKTVLEGRKDFADSHTELRFNNVSFYYPNAEKPTLSEINITFKQGEVTAIIGGTGSGKTTLVQLIPRFYEKTSGEIFYNGLEITESTVAKIRQEIGYVPQKSVLFSGTVNENIKFGKENATEAEIRRAAQIAQADEFINRLPKAYETKIEQGGANLSGGQKQRLTIARALVRKPKIYIFDDSFSALDYATDKRLRAQLKDEINDAIVIIVAQRVNTVIDAEQIVVLDGGKVVGKGRHDDLIKTNQIYQEIVASQLGEGDIS